MAHIICAYKAHGKQREGNVERKKDITVNTMMVEICEIEVDGGKPHDRCRVEIKGRISSPYGRPSQYNPT